MPKELHDRIQTLLDHLVSEESERGAQVAVYFEGKLIVDAWAGMADVRSGRKVDGETLFPVFSTTKGITATAVHLLAERGQLDYDAPVAKYWLTFGTNGKEGITLRHVLAHSAGIPYMPDATPKQLADWDFMCEVMTQLQPAWEPGTKQLYHPITYGWILGEVIRRVDGRPFQPFLEQEICRPLGIRTMFVGLPPELEPQVAWLEAKPECIESISPPPRTNPPCVTPLYEWMNRSDAKWMCQPAANGIMNARAVARHYAALLPGGIDGVELLPPGRMQLATELQTPRDGWEEGLTARKGLGYQLGIHVHEMGGSATAFGHNGHGGSVGFAEPKHRLAVSVVRNLFSGGSLGSLVWREIQETLGLS
jgi:CubicO group peptidase (beta-lactamase class C family)